MRRAVKIMMPGVMGGKSRQSPNFLAGGIAAANCVAFYAPKGARSYAESKINLANPGTYDAINGLAYPSWDSVNGWLFNRESATYLKTLIVPETGWSMIIKFSGMLQGASHYLVGSRSSLETRFFIAFSAANLPSYGNGGGVAASTAMTNSGVLAFAGQQGYRNGIIDGAAIGAWNGTAAAIDIGVKGAASGEPAAADFTSGYIQYVGIYNSILTTEQVELLTMSLDPTITSIFKNITYSSSIGV